MSKFLYILAFVSLTYSSLLLSGDLTNINNDYSIQFPKEWEILKNVMDTDVIAIAPKIDPEDLFRENVNIIKATLDVPISPEEYYLINIKSLGNILSDFDLEKSEDILVDGSPAKKIVFTHTIGVVNAKVLQYLILKDNKAYVLTFSADPMDFPNYLIKFEEIMQSFKFKKDFI